MAQHKIRLKCTGLNVNEQDKTVYAQFSNENPGDRAYSYMTLPASPGAFTVGTVYSFSVEAENEVEEDKEKMGLP